MKIKKGVAIITTAILIISNITFIMANTIDSEIDEILKGYKNKDVSVYYKDLDTGFEYTYNEDFIYENASIKKVPTYLYVYKQIKEGNIDPNTKLTYDESHIYGGTGIIQGQPLGTSYTIQDLLTKSIVYSDNVAFIMLQNYVNSQEYIDFFDEIGGRVSYYKYNIKNVAGYMQYLIDFVTENPEYKDQIVSDFTNTIFNDKIPAGVGEDVKVAHKIGVLGSSYHDASIVLDEFPYILIIMSENGSAYKVSDMFKSITELVHSKHRTIVREEKYEFYLGDNKLDNNTIIHKNDKIYLDINKFIDKNVLNINKNEKNIVFDFFGIIIEYNKNKEVEGGKLLNDLIIFQDDKIYIDENFIINHLDFEKSSAKTVRNFQVINTLRYTKS